MKQKIINLKGKGLKFWKEVLDNPKYVYIGRKDRFKRVFIENSKFYNPFTIKNKKVATEMFRKWIYGLDYNDLYQEHKKELLDNIYLLKNKILCCWCKPDICHGDILVEYLEEDDKNKTY